MSGSNLYVFLMVNLKVSLGELELENPIIASSGTYGYGTAFLDFYDVNRLGSFSLKGTTGEERFGNPLPRAAECKYGVLSSVGLQNPGVEAVLQNELPELAKVYHKKVMANVCGFSPEEYAYVAERISTADIVGIVELNLSCPNVHDGGMAFGTDPKNVNRITKAVKEVSSKPVYVKLTSAVTDIVSIARAAEEAGADGLCVANTMPGIKIDLRTRRPVLGSIKGGYSSPAMFPLSARMVYDIYEAVNIPIIGVGGICSAADVIEMMMCGASAVQVGSQNLLHPSICVDILDELPSVMEKYGIENIKDITGAAHQ